MNVLNVNVKCTDNHHKLANWSMPCNAQVVDICLCLSKSISLSVHIYVYIYTKTHTNFSGLASLLSASLPAHSFAPMGVDPGWTTACAAGRAAAGRGRRARGPLAGEEAAPAEAEAPPGVPWLPWSMSSSSAVDTVLGVTQCIHASLHIHLASVYTYIYIYTHTHTHTHHTHTCTQSTTHTPRLKQQHCHIHPPSLPSAAAASSTSDATPPTGTASTAAAGPSSPPGTASRHSPTPPSTSPHASALSVGCHATQHTAAAQLRVASALRPATSHTTSLASVPPVAKYRPVRRSCDLDHGALVEDAYTAE